MVLCGHGLQIRAIGNNLIYPGAPQHNDPTSEYYYFNMKYEQYHPIKKINIVIQTDEIKLWELK
jgi:hypothetical protein